jgi:hypothetical protein
MLFLDISTKSAVSRHQLSKVEHIFQNNQLKSRVGQQTLIQTLEIPLTFDKN